MNQPVTLQLSEANRTACVDVVVIRDGVYEDDEMFLMRLSTSDEASIIIQSTVNVTIQDSDSKGPPFFYERKKNTKINVYIIS